MDATLNSSVTPWKKALSSSSPITKTQDISSSSPTSVLSQSVIKAWDTLQDDKWLSSAASLGLTAGAAALTPSSSPKNSESSSESECEIESLPDTSSDATEESNSDSSLSSEEDDRVKGNVLKYPSPIIKTPPPSVARFSLESIPKMGDLSKGLLPTPPRIQLVTRAVQSVSPAAKKGRKDPMRTIVLSSAKKAGTGVFIPARLGDKSGKGKAGHTTTALLPERLVKTLRLKIDPATSAVLAKPSTAAVETADSHAGRFYGSLHDYHREMNAKLRSQKMQESKDGEGQLVSKLPDDLFC